MLLIPPLRINVWTGTAKNSLDSTYSKMIHTDRFPSSSEESKMIKGVFIV